MTTTTARVQMHRDTAANWTSTNPTLAVAEWAYETDTGRVKLGNGATAWTSLPYHSSLPEAVIALTDAATIATDASLGNVFTVTLGGNRTLGNPTNPTSGQKILYRVTQDATGSRTLAYGTAFRFSTDVPSPTLTTTASKTDYLGFIYNAAASKWDCLAIAKGY